MRDGQEAGRVRFEQRAKSKGWRMRVRGQTGRNNRDENRVALSLATGIYRVRIESASEALTLSTPGFQLATLAISRDRILPILVRLLILPLAPLTRETSRQCRNSIGDAGILRLRVPDYVERHEY